MSAQEERLGKIEERLNNVAEDVAYIKGKLDNIASTSANRIVIYSAAAGASISAIVSFILLFLH